MHRTLSTDARLSIVATDRSGSDFAITWQRILKEAKLYWPKNTAKNLARITETSERTCYRWLSGRVTPPSDAILDIILALRKAYIERGRIFEQLDLGL